MKLNFNSAESKRIKSHLQLLGFSESHITGLLLTIHKWQEESGKEWTVNRIKSLKTLFIQQLGGNFDYHPTWLAYRKEANGQIVPKGSFGSFSRL